jgi:hypothetical protein
MQSFFLQVFDFFTGLSAASILTNPLILKITSVLGVFKIISPVVQKAVDQIVKITPTKEDDKQWSKIKNFLNTNKLVGYIVKFLSWVTSVSAKK